MLTQIFPSHLTKGIFITLEGSEGCGKSTQLTHLATFFQQQLAAIADPREVIVVREPGGTVLGEKIRYLLKHDPDVTGMSAHAELLLFEASRAQLVREVIQPALARRAVVLCDRFFDSTRVYQGVARNLVASEVAFLNQFATGGLVPDLTILLDLEVAIGRERIKKRTQEATIIDRMEQESEVFFQAVRNGYLELAMAEPQRWIVIDASAPEELITQKIFLQLKERLHGLF